MECACFQKEDKTICFFPGNSPEDPLVVLLTYEEEGRDILSLFSGSRHFHLLEISGIKWNDELSPWPMKGIYKHDPGYGGQADAFLSFLDESFFDEVFQRHGIRPSKCILAGYSLAGLFSLYAGTKTNLFDAVVSCSGSMWFDNFLEYMREHPLNKRVQHVYLSLGDKEAEARNPVIQTVRKNTESLFEHFKEEGIETAFVLHPGGHFADVTSRQASAIKTTLERICK